METGFGNVNCLVTGKGRARVLVCKSKKSYGLDTCMPNFSIGGGLFPISECPQVLEEKLRTKKLEDLAGVFVLASPICPT